MPALPGFNRQGSLQVPTDNKLVTVPGKELPGYPPSIFLHNASIAQRGVHAVHHDRVVLHSSLFGFFEIWICLRRVPFEPKILQYMAINHLLGPQDDIPFKAMLCVCQHSIHRYHSDVFHPEAESLLRLWNGHLRIRSHPLGLSLLRLLLGGIVVTHCACVSVTPRRP